MPSRAIFTLKHGNYNSLGGLTDSGKETVRHSGVDLLGEVVERDLPKPVVIAADVARSKESGKELADILSIAFRGEVEVVTSHRLTLAGQQVEGVHNPADLAAAVIKEEGVSIKEDQPVILVADGVLTALVEDRYDDMLIGGIGVKPGEWAEYDTERWDGSRFNQAAARMIDRQMSVNDRELVLA